MMFSFHQHGAFRRAGSSVSSPTPYLWLSAAQWGRTSLHRRSETPFLPLRKYENSNWLRGSALSAWCLYSRDDYSLQLHAWSRVLHEVDSLLTHMPVCCYARLLKLYTHSRIRNAMLTRRLQINSDMPGPINTRNRLSLCTRWNRP